MGADVVRHAARLHEAVQEGECRRAHGRTPYWNSPLVALDTGIASDLDQPHAGLGGSHGADAEIDRGPTLSLRTAPLRAHRVRARRLEKTALGALAAPVSERLQVEDRAVLHEPPRLDVRIARGDGELTRLAKRHDAGRVRAQWTVTIDTSDRNWRTSLSTSSPAPRTEGTESGQTSGVSKTQMDTDPAARRAGWNKPFPPSPNHHEEHEQDIGTPN